MPAADRRRWAWPAAVAALVARRRSRCACGASATACRSSTTPTRTRTSSPARSGCSGTPTTRTTSSTRRPTPTCCTPRSRSASAGATASRRPSRPTPATSSRSRARCRRVLGAVAVGLLGVGGRAAVRPPHRPRRRRAAGGRLPARPLRALRAQRRPDARAAVPRARRRRRRLRARAPRRLRARRRRARARLRDEVHRRDRAAAAAGGGRWSAAGRRRTRGGSAGSCSRACWRWRCFLHRQPVRAARLRLVPRRPQRAVGGVERRRRQARPDRRQRDPLLPRDDDLGARLAARAGRARRRGGARRARLAPRARARARRSSSSSLFMGTQDRFFARWLLPVYPLLCLLAAYGAVLLATGRSSASAAPRPAWAAALAGVLLCAQGLVFAIHNDVVLARADTRQLARDWMVENVPAGHEGRDRAGRARRVGERHRPRAARPPATARAGASGRPRARA